MYKIILAYSLFIIIGCSSETSPFTLLKPTQIVSKNLDDEKILIGENLILPGILNPSRLLVCGDYLLVNSMNSEPFQLRVISLNKADSSITAIPTGEGPGELLDVYQMQCINDEMALIYSMRLKKVVFYPIDSLLHSGKPVQETSLRGPYPKYPFIIDNHLMAMSYTFKPFKRIILYDHSGQAFNYDMNYPHMLEGMSEMDYPEIFTSNIAIAGDQLVIAHQNMDLIQLFHWQDTGFINSMNIYGPDLYLPEFKSVDHEDGAHETLPITDKTKDAYFSVQANAQEIWALYSGMISFPSDKMDTRDRQQLDQLLVFDWNGKLIYRYKLSSPILSRFTVDFNRHEIYGIAIKDDVQIVRFRY